VKRAFLVGLVMLCLLAVWIPAPLEVAGDAARAPNPAKSAWFLLWIQELVSYHTVAMYVAVLLALLLVALPWLPMKRAQSATWFPRDLRLPSFVVLVTVAGIVALTIVALFFRGTDWCLVSPF
jgi:hypothetical protein